MKALVYEKANTLDNFAIELREIPEPQLRASDVLVKVRAVGINPGEAFIRGVRSAGPGGRILLGWEFAGEVVGIGSGVERFAVGDRVFGTGDMTRDGAWAERLAVDHRIIAKIPGEISYSEAACLPIGSVTASEALFRENDHLPFGVQRVLIVGGAGAVGSMATQLLKAKTNAFVIATASRPDSRAWCSQMGADLVIDHSRDVAQQLAEAGIPQVDMVLSLAKTSENIPWIAKILKPFGHLSIVDAGQLDFGPLMAKAPSIHLEMVFSRSMFDSEPQKLGRILEEVAGLLVQRRVKPIVTTRLEGLTVESMKTAHQRVETHQTIGKTVILESTPVLDFDKTG
jgi:NADPH2:quinone reductase